MKKGCSHPLGGPMVGPGEEGAADEIREVRGLPPGHTPNCPLVGQKATRPGLCLRGARQEQGTGSG